MANIDSIQAFADGKQRFGYLKNDYFLVSGHMYYKSIDYPIAVWYGPEEVGGEDIAYINGDRRGNDHTIAQYVIDELHRRDVKTKIVTLKELQEIIDD